MKIRLSACGFLASIALAAPSFAQVEPGYLPVYTYNLPSGANYNSTPPGAGVLVTDTHGSFANGSFDRVAYQLTLAGSTNARSPNGTVYVSFDAAGFTNDASKIGIPYAAASEAYKQSVTNMNVSSTVAGVTPATGITGNVEFWPNDYSEGLNGVYDYNDDRAGNGNYGSMQIFNTGAGQTLFAYNNWGSDGGPGDLGIGNNTTIVGGNNKINPDWTFANNIGDYTTRTLAVYVHPVPEPASLGLAGIATLALLRRRSHTP